MLLYDNQDSGNCYKVRLLLAHLGLPYERKELSVVERSDRARVLGALNPGLRVPTLVLEDGRSIGESNAILWYLGDPSSYVPEARFERAQVLQWQFFEQYDHEPNLAVARFWLRHRASDLDPRALAERHAAGHRALRAMERHLADRSFLVGGRYSIADISLFAYTHVARDGGFDLDPYPAIRSWLDRVAAQPGHVTMEE